MKVLRTEIEKHRAFWAKIAKANNWYAEPFYIQVWIDKTGNVTDSISHIGLTKDIVIEG
jgi:protoheme ferro-lyase